MLNFNQAEERVFRALNLMRSAEMRPLLEFVKNQLEDSKNSLVTAEGDRIPILQGRARYLQDFVDAVEDAAATLEKMR